MKESTGLTDKQGTEIYEGDKVSITLRKRNEEKSGDRLDNQVYDYYEEVHEVVRGYIGIDCDNGYGGFLSCETRVLLNQNKTLYDRKDNCVVVKD